MPWKRYVLNEDIWTISATSIILHLLLTLDIKFYVLPLAGITQFGGFEKHKNVLKLFYSGIFLKIIILIFSKVKYNSLHNKFFKWISWFSANIPATKIAHFTLIYWFPGNTILEILLFLIYVHLYLRYITEPIQIFFLRIIHFIDVEYRCSLKSKHFWKINYFFAIN